jgi:hypothetical protein
LPDIVAYFEGLEARIRGERLYLKFWGALVAAAGAHYDGSVYVSDTLKPGAYRLRLALLDPRTGDPAIKLAIEGRQPDGWYDVGEIQVE